MAQRKLNTHVTVHRRGDDGEVLESQTFGPDDDRPSWADKAITNPNVYEDGKGIAPQAPSSGQATTDLERSPGLADNAVFQSVETDDRDKAEPASQTAAARPRPPAKATTNK